MIKYDVRFKNKIFEVVSSKDWTLDEFNFVNFYNEDGDEYLSIPREKILYIMMRIEE
jgi:hypothetical protein